MAEEFVRVDGAAKVEAIIDGLSAAINNEPMMLEIGEYIRFRIQTRTAEGKDVSGKDFKPYSPRYRLFRQEAGHPTSKVNLFFTGSMMSSMAVAATLTKAKVYFLNTMASSSQLRKAGLKGRKAGASLSTDTSKMIRNPEKAYFLNEKREFFALNRDDVKGMTDIMERYYQAVYDRLNR